MSETALSAIAEINPGARLPKEITGSNEVSFIPMSDVSESGGWITRQTRPLRSVMAGFTAFEEGDVLVAKITPCLENGKGAHARGLRNGIGFGSTEFHVLRAKSGVEPRFVFHITQSRRFRQAAERLMVGSAGQQRVQRQFFDEFLVRDFSQGEQRAITQILDTLDTAIHETEALIDKLKAVKQGLLHDLLTRGIDANGQLRPPQSEAPQLYKESPLGWIPREWEVQSIAALLTDIEAGKSPSCPDTPASSGSWGVLKVSAVHPDGFRSDQNKLVEHESLVNPAYEVHSGDLLITRANTPELVGMACLVEDPQPKLMLCDKTLRLLVNDGIASKEYLFLCLQQPYIRSQIESSATGTSMSMKNISQAAIRNLLVAVAPLQEQIEISVRANVLALKLRQEMAVLEKLRQQKSGLMDDLLTGRVRVTPLLESVQQVAAQTEA